MRERFKIKKVFTRLLASYIIMLMLPSLLIWGLYQEMYSRTIESYIKDSITSLSQIATRFDRYLTFLDSLSMRLAYEMDFSSIMHMSKPKPAESNVYRIIEFNNRLNKKLTIFDGDMGYSVILKDNEFIFTNNSVVYGLHFYFDHFRTYQSIDYNKWYEMSFNCQRRILFPMDSIKIKKKVTNAITYNYPIKGGADWQTKGVVQFLITSDYLEDLFLPLSANYRGNSYILNSKADIIAYMGEENPISCARLDAMKGDRGYFYCDQGIALYSKSEDSGLIFVTYIPDNIITKKADGAKRKAVFSISIYIAVGILICITFSQKYTSPAKNIIASLQSCLKKNNDGISPCSEYEYIKKGISTLIADYKLMRHSIDQKRRAIRISFIEHLIGGQFKDENAIKSLAKQAGIYLEANMYCVAVLEKTTAFEHLELYDGSYGNPDVKILFSHLYNEQNIVILFGFIKRDREMNYKCIRQMLENINSQILIENNRYANIGVGKMYVDIIDIPFSFNQALYSATIDSNHRTNFILKYESISCDIDTIFYPTKLEAKLINSTKHGEIQQITSIFEKIIYENTRVRNLSYVMQEILIANIKATFIKIANDLVLKRGIDSFMECIDKDREFTESLDKLKNQFILVGTDVRNERDKKEMKQKRNFKEFIMQKYMDPMLSVALMASAFSISQTYFSQLFKDIMGKPFSVYVEEIRLDKAKELLMDTQLTIEEIASLVGYNNSTTFRRAFKRVIGVPPSIYRSKELIKGKEYTMYSH